MKQLCATIKNMVRNDNKTTWLPILGSLAITFLTPIIDLVLGYFIDMDRTVTCILLIVGLIFLFVFCVLACNYMITFHSIFDTLGEDPGRLKACSYLSAIERNNIWNTFKLVSLSVNYSFKQPVYSSQGIPVYPFSIEYIVHGQALEEMTTVFYHIIGKYQKSNNIVIEYAFGDSPYRLVAENNIDLRKQSITVLTFFSLFSSENYRANSTFSYRIRISYGPERGMIARKSHSLLLSTSNITPLCSGILANVTVTAPACFSNDFYPPLASGYVKGFNANPHNESIQFDESREDSDNQSIYKTSIRLSPKMLYSFKFTGKHNT